MLIFITSIRHPHNSDSYQRVVGLLDQTLESICAQTSVNFQVVVVCNEVPNLPSRQNVDYVKVNFPPPSKLKRPTTGMQAIRLDRGSKYVIGLLYARRYSPDYIMFFDADDYISCRIVEFVERHPVVDGWYFEHGYSYQQGANSVRLLDNFYKMCGTSHIFQFSLFPLPHQLTVHSSLQSITTIMDDQYLNSVLGSHRFARRYYKSRAVDLEMLPFAGAVWVLGNGENHSGLPGKPGNLSLSNDLINEFSIPGIYS